VWLVFTIEATCLLVRLVLHQGFFPPSGAIELFSLLALDLSRVQ
jgi:hypothetical protein